VPEHTATAVKKEDVSRAAESRLAKEGDSQPPKSSKEKLKMLWRKYGWLSVGTYLGMYASTLGGIFISLEFDLFNAATFGLDTATLVDMVIPSCLPPCVLLCCAIHLHLSSVVLPHCGKVHRRDAHSRVCEVESHIW
jgi:hypothetical protein